MKRLVIGILAHVDAGKTTLSEGLLYRCGALRRLGRVDHGDAFLDTDAQERARGITIFSKQALLEMPGLSVTLLAMTLACQYFMNNIDDEAIFRRAARRMRTFAVLFVACFVAWLLALVLADGWAVDAAGTVSIEPYKYLHNLVEMPYVAAALLIGVVSVLWSVWLGWRGSRRAVWFGGVGTVLTVLSLLLLAGWNDTAYYPSLADMQSSLTIRNSSSSLFTLRTMAWVSLFVPFVAAYIWYAWRAMNRRPITREEIRGDDHQY